MRRTAVLAATLSAVAFGVAAVPTGPAGAGEIAPISGRLVAWDRTPIANASVRLTTLTSKGDIGSATTDEDGRFSINPTFLSENGYEVHIDADRRIQGGEVADQGSNRAVQFVGTDGDDYPAGTGLGRIYTTPSFVSGRLVNAANGKPVRRVVVRLRGIFPPRVTVVTDRTGANGRFRLDGFIGEDFGFYADGGPRGFENGWRACNGAVVPTWGLACQSPLGAIGKVRIEKD